MFLVPVALKSEKKKKKKKKASILRLEEQEIPLKILKQSRFTYSYEMLTDCINGAIVRENIFPDSLKFADITPLHKKDETTNKENYRPVRN